MRLTLILICLFALQCVGGMYSKGDKHIVEKNYDAAITEFKVLTESNPEDYLAFIRLGDAYRAKQDFSSAVTAYNSALSINPGHKDAKSKWLSTSIENGRKLAAGGRTRMAVETYQEILRKYPDNIETRKLLGNLFKDAGQLDRADEEFSKLLETNPEDVESKTAIDEIKSAANNAEKLYKNALKEYNQKMFYEAAGSLKEAIEIKPDHKEARYYMYMAEGRNLIRHGKVADMWKAIQAFGNAAMIHPERPEPDFYMAQTYEKKDSKDFDRPISLYKKVIEKAPNGKLAKESREKIKKLTTLKKFYKKGKGSC